jgi:amino acid transporter
LWCAYFLIALCFAEVASETTTSGGVYSYIETAFGPYAGIIANNLYWFGACVLSDAAVANALADFECPGE